ncbi:MAG: hypothetical protein Q9160_001956 [Pyrenula sp. 1 TL-2023]
MRLSTFSVPVLAYLPTILADTLSVTPHEQYSSSLGVLGCKIDTNYVAYFPGWPQCDNLCKKVTYADRTVYLLNIDSSGGAHDISYNAWNYLVTGHYATEPGMATYGGGVNMDVSDADMSFCLEHIKAKDGNGNPVLAFSAPTENFLDACRAQGSSWTSRNSMLLNIYTPTCTYGIDEPCHFDPTTNLRICDHQLGLMPKMDTETVMNVQYGTGALIPSLV